MIRVYFERGYSADLFAVFFDEHTYACMSEQLERLCKDLGYDRMTESEEWSLETASLTDKIMKL